jgi:hypothetical protein
MRKGRGIRGVRGKGIVDTVKKVFTGETATKLYNMLPSNSKLARPGFPGELHAILQNPNGSFSKANWMGPSTQVKKRVLRDDPGIVPSDTISKMHDLQYSTARTKKDIRDADNRMLKSLGRVEREGLDSKFNTKLGKAVIGAKVKLEDMGVSNSFGDIKEISEEDRKLYEDEIEKLKNMGYGLKKFRSKALKSSKKNKNKETHVKSVGKEYKGKDSNLKAVIKLDDKGSGIMDVVSNVVETVVPNVYKDMKRKYPEFKPTQQLVFDTKKLFMDKLKDVSDPTKIKSLISKLVMPQVLQLINDAMNKKIGSGLSMEDIEYFGSEFADGFVIGWNATKDLLKNVPKVGDIASKLPSLPGPSNMDELKKRSAERTKKYKEFKKAEANREQADKDTLAQKGQVATEAEKKVFDEFRKRTFGQGKKSKKGKSKKGGEYSVEDLKKISMELVDKLKDTKVKPETLMSKIKKYLPTLGKTALVTVGAIVGKKLFDIGNRKIGEFLFNQIAQECKNMYQETVRNIEKKKYNGKGIYTPGKGIYTPGKGVFTSGGEKYSEKEVLKGYKKLRNKILDKNLE